jgi:Zn-dependent oligopeptidase
MPVMQYADDRNLRRLMHEAYSTRASDLGGNVEWNNGPLILRILALRHEAAKLLGYRNYAEVSLVPKMAQHPEEVIAFLRDLARRAKPFAQRDFAELTAFARSDLGLATLEPWDLAYASEKLKASRYAYNEQEVRQYFPEDRVLAGLFRSSRRSTGSRSANRKPRSGIPTCVSSRSAMRAARWSASSTSTSMRGPASRAARGWTTRSTAAPCMARCGTRSHS